GGLDQRLVDVGAGVEQADFDRPDLLFHPREQVLHLRFAARIDAERVDLVPGGLQFVDEALGLGGFAATDAYLIPTFGEAPGDRRPNCIARADEYCHAATVGHRISSASSYLEPH